MTQDNKRIMITKEQFFENVDNLPKQIFSGQQHKMYTNIRRLGSICYGERESNSKFKIDLDVLYQAYLDNDVINTNTLRDGEYITDRKRSPSIAIMRNAGLIDDNGHANK